ncbi:MAG: beta-galactosidase [Candidatus Alcyoniella australis]|nr:beta-galactosidase [Candidatus Alcyoniella australis]
MYPRSYNYSLLLVFVALALLATTAVSADQGFFSVEQRDGRWWFIDPDGEIFISTGVNLINPGGHYAPALGYSPYQRNIIELYGSEQAWAAVTLERMEQWGLNTLGGWSKAALFPDTPYTNVLYLSGANWESGVVPDYFSEEFLDRVEQICSSTVAAGADDPLLLGWFIDNEMRWGADWRVLRDLFADYYAFDQDAPGKAALVEFLRGRYNNEIEAFNAAWGTRHASFDALYGETRTSAMPANQAQAADREAFLALLAEQFFSTVEQGIREYDQQHLILGSRLVSWVTPRVVLEAATRHCDVLSINHYRVWPTVADLLRTLQRELNYVGVDDESTLSEYFDEAGLPILVSEFSMRGMDAGLPNTWPPNVLFITADTQQQRAYLFEQMARTWLEGGYVIGYHWFDWMDEPVSGRFDGENSNFGLVTELDEPYELLTATMAAVNATAYDWEPPAPDDDDDVADDDDDDDSGDDDVAGDDDDDDSGCCG